MEAQQDTEGDMGLVLLFAARLEGRALYFEDFLRQVQHWVSHVGGYPEVDGRTRQCTSVSDCEDGIRVLALGAFNDNFERFFKKIKPIRKAIRAIVVRPEVLDGYFEYLTEIVFGDRILAVIHERVRGFFKSI